MTSFLRSLVTWPAMLVLTLLAVPALAQVPQDMTFTGRLVDTLGDPLAGPVDLELRVFDGADGGAKQLYGEQHLNVPLDATGGFSVRLGLGTSPSGSFDAALFSDAGRWLEVVVGGEVLTPRQSIGAVPWALIAQHVAPWDPNATPRFEDCSDGTVADHKTGLLWEKKTGTPGTIVDCETTGCSDPHDANNGYAWSSSGADPDGGTFTDFVARLDGEYDPFGATGCFANRCDWRLPAISELQTLLTGPNAAPGQATTCSAAPCIDPDFAALGGPTTASPYWSETTDSGNPTLAWAAGFDYGDVFQNPKASSHLARAVRVGSCE